MLEFFQCLNKVCLKNVVKKFVKKSFEADFCVILLCKCQNLLSICFTEHIF